MSPTWNRVGQQFFRDLAADLTFEAIVIGAEAAFEHRVSADDVAKFAELSGDYNPLHVDAAFGKASNFGRCVVHGMFLAGLFSRLVGMHLPGRRCLYLSQTLDFVQPAFVGDLLGVSGVVMQKQEATRSLIVRTQITNASGLAVVRGKAHVRVL